jgi:hypothetical protein
MSVIIGVAQAVASSIPTYVRSGGLVLLFMSTARPQAWFERSSTSPSHFQPLTLLPPVQRNV